MVPTGFPVLPRDPATKKEVCLKNEIYPKVHEEVGEIEILAATGQVQRARKRTYGFLCNHTAKLWGLSKAGLWNLPMVCDLFTEDECLNYFIAAGYKPE